MSQPLPIDVSPISQPLPDPAHEAIRSAVINALTQVWSDHEALVAQINSLSTQLTQAQSDIAALTTRVAALENPIPAPTP